jgi:PAS domain S-box-containing protein
MRLAQIVPESLRPTIQVVFEQLLAASGGELNRNANLTKDRREIICEWHNTPLVDDDGTVMGIASMVRDVTGEIIALRDLEQREEDLRLITDALPALIAYVDRDGRYRFNNRQYVYWLGREPAELRGQRLSELFGTRFAAELKVHDQAVSEGRSVRFENRIRTAKGERDVDVTFVPHIHEGAYHGHYVLALDVTDRKVVEREASRATRIAGGETHRRTRRGACQGQTGRAAGVSGHAGGGAGARHEQHAAAHALRPRRAGRVG